MGRVLNLLSLKNNSFEDEEKLTIGSKEDFLWRRTFVLHCIWFYISYFSKFQSSIAGVKTPRLEAFFITLESYQSVNVENGLT